LHDINHAMRLSENVLAMKDGKTAAHGKGVITAELLETIYEVDVAGYMRKMLGAWEHVSFIV